MNIALIGYGKMGKTIERIARERGHDIVSIIDIDNRNDFNSEAFKSADAAIEFTAPQVALENYKAESFQQRCAAALIRQLAERFRRRQRNESFNQYQYQ